MEEITNDKTVQIYKTILKLLFLHFQYYKWENNANNLKCVYPLLKKSFLISSPHSHIDCIYVAFIFINYPACIYFT